MLSEEPHTSKQRTLKALLLSYPDRKRRDLLRLFIVTLRTNMVTPEDPVLICIYKF